jgi:thiosulfate/3-mercaptopyruvate sulfurtransferase
MMPMFASVVYLLAADPAGYVKPKLLAEPADLAKPPVRVLDCRSERGYQDGHVAGAVRAPLSAWSKAYTADKADAAFWKAELAAVGVTPAVPVVVYADDMREACRGWWLLTRAGVPDVRVLNGGYTGYVAAKQPTSTTPTPATADPHDWKPAPEQHASKADVLKMIADKTVTILDGRTIEEYEAGRVPGAVHLEWVDFLTADKSRFKSPDELAALLKAKSVKPTDPLCSYCQSGGRASVVAFGLALMGADAKNYYRSWSEWGTDATTPKEKGKK